MSYISATYVYNQPRIRTMNVNRSNKVKDFPIKKDKKQAISYENYDRYRLRRWPSTSLKYASLSRISAVYSETSNR